MDRKKAPRPVTLMADVVIAQLRAEAHAERHLLDDDLRRVPELDPLASAQSKRAQHLEVVMAIARMHPVANWCRLSPHEHRRTLDKVLQFRDAAPDPMAGEQLFAGLQGLSLIGSKHRGHREERP